MNAKATIDREPGRRVARADADGDAHSRARGGPRSADPLDCAGIVDSAALAELMRGDPTLRVASETTIYAAAAAQSGVRDEQLHLRDPDPSSSSPDSEA